MMNRRAIVAPAFLEVTTPSYLDTRLSQHEKSMPDNANPGNCLRLVTMEPRDPTTAAFLNQCNSQQHSKYSPQKHREVQLSLHPRSFFCRSQDHCRNHNCTNAKTIRL